MRKNFIAYNAEYGDTESFETFDEAKKWLDGIWHENMADTDGFYDGLEHGSDYIAVITHRSKFIETDNKNNYCQIDCSDCKKEKCDGEEWPYSNQFDKVGNIELKEIAGMEAGEQ